MYGTWRASLLDAFLISLGLLFLLHRYSSRQVLCHLIRMDQDGLAASKASTSPLEGRDAFYSDSGRPRFCAIFSVFARFCARILRPLHHYAISFLHCQPLFLPLNDFAPIILACRYFTNYIYHLPSQTPFNTLITFSSQSIPQNSPIENPLRTHLLFDAIDTVFIRTIKQCWS